MIELIGIIACLIACIGVPFQVASIRSGAAFRKAPEKRAQILAATSKQFALLSGLGIFFGVVMIGLAFIEEEPGEWVFKALSGVLWLILSGLCFWARSRIADVPE